MLQLVVRRFVSLLDGRTLALSFQLAKARVLARVASIGRRAESGGAAGRVPLRRQISAFLICTGLFLLLLVAGAYGWMYREQQRLVAQWQALPDTQTESLRPPEGGMTLLYIPKINLRAAILEGTDRKALLLAPGHLKHTTWPGDTGNAVVAGHRDTFFRHLPELQKGDDIYVRRQGREFRYVVSRKSIVSPSDVSVIRATTDSRLTLVTCYPTYFIGPAPQRLIVVATLMSEGTKPSLAQSQDGNGNAIP